MKLIVQQKSETPIYLQLYNQIVTQILCGELTANDSLPSIRFVARDLEISVIPIKTAYEMLEKDGYIYTIPAKGTYVADIENEKNAKRVQLAKTRLADAIDYCKDLNLTGNDILYLINKILNK